MSEQFVNNKEAPEEVETDYTNMAHNGGSKQRTGEVSPDTTACRPRDHDKDSLLDVEINMLVKGCILGSDSSVEVPLPDDDPRAMTILLNIVHGRNRRVPGKDSLRMLTSIAVLAEKYQMMEALEPFHDSWIDKLRPKLPTEYTRKREAHFQVDTIMKRREKALSECYCPVEETIQQYQRAETLYSRHNNEQLRTSCDSMLLGSPLKSTFVQGLYPAPDAPYGRASFNDLVVILNALSVQSLCDIVCPFGNGGEKNRAHGLKAMIVEKISGIYERLSGLDLKDFKK
ncbi:hypothetical protein BKA65DRAFT_549739 [Rhexocercosporidium sp. MPI-PUGE-AT-0058]|nr:hypothetical protein BKA65DRAFT_549739 [Rhexocercosporidium sp. MPI-PUGE-AT-0058]